MNVRYAYSDNKADRIFSRVWYVVDPKTKKWLYFYMKITKY